MYRLFEQIDDIWHTIHCWIGLQKYVPSLMAFAICDVSMGRYQAAIKSVLSIKV